MSKLFGHKTKKIFREAAWLFIFLTICCFAFFSWHSVEDLSGKIAFWGGIATLAIAVILFLLGRSRFRGFLPIVF